MANINVSFDLETLSTRPDAHILSIGTAALVNGELKTFHAFVSQESQERHVDSETVAWWEKQSAEAQERVRNGVNGADGLSIVLTQLTAWYGALGDDSDRLFPWGNGAAFDIAILDHAYAQMGLKAPWAFWTVRDLRTLKDIGATYGLLPNIKREGVHHDARDDAVHQLRIIEAVQTNLTQRLAA